MSTLKIKRLTAEYRKIVATPIDTCVDVRVNQDNLGVWYFLFRVDDGEFVFKIKHADNYPFGPPDLSVLTPNGVIDVGCLICTTFSSYHKDQWDPSMTTEKMIIGLMSYYHSAKDGEMTGVGVNVQPEAARKVFAEASANYNRTKLVKEVRDLFYPVETGTE